MGCPHGDEPQCCAICLRVQLQQAQRKGAAAWLLFERRCDELRQAIKRAEAAERTLVRAQRIIGSLHTEKASLIQRIAALTPAEAQEEE